MKILIGKRKTSKTNQLGESHAQAKLLTHLNRLEDLKVLNESMLKDNQKMETRAERKYLEKLERDQLKAEAQEYEKPILTLLIQKQHLHRARENVTVSILKQITTNNKDLRIEKFDDGEFQSSPK